MSLLSKIFGSNELDPSDIEAVVNAYGKVLGSSNAIVRDISELPLSKDKLAKTLFEAIKMTPAGNQREQLKTGFVMLGDFQDLELCEKDGVNPSVKGLAESEKMLAALTKAGL